jgi:predicted nuclease with TOPRIM domain
MHDWRLLKPPRAWLIDLDASRLAWVTSETRPNSDWTPIVALVGSGEERNCYRASNPAEDGLAPPLKLRNIWPNLTEVASSPAVSVTIDTLIPHADLASATIWLIVDCLPAVAILRGAVELLQKCSVVRLRVCANEVADIPQSSKEEASQLLAEYGFNFLSSFETNHPAILDLVFLRDWRGELLREKAARVVLVNDLNAVSDQARIDQTQASREIARLGSLCEQLTVEVDYFKRSAEELQAANGQLNDENEKLVRQSSLLGELCETRLLQKEQSDQQLVHYKRQAHRRRSWVVSVLRLLKNARSAIVALRHERNEKADQLAGQIEALVGQQKQYEVLTKERDRLAGELSSTNAANEQASKLEHARAAEMAELQNANCELVRERSNQAQRFNAQSAQIVALQEGTIRLIEERDNLGKELKTIRDVAEELAERESGLLKEKSALMKENLTLTEATEELQHQIGQLRVELAQLNENAAKKDSEMSQLTENAIAAAQREQDLLEEIVRAEAQIDLIKDVLIRDVG